MDVLALLEQYGIPICVAIAFGFFIWKQNQYIQDDLTQDLKQRFERLESIIIKLIDQQKLMQIELAKLKAHYHSLVSILTKLIRRTDTK
jgi:chaperonin cofactor prefoldin